MTNSESQATEPNTPLFKAVGIIKGEINIGENGTSTVVISGKSYRLKYASDKIKVFQALKLQLKNTGNNEQRLIVHPRVIHFPKREKPYIIYFELVGFESPSIQDKGIFNDLNDLEFKLSGLWQFIPVCRVPCVSVFRNFSEERKLFIKSAEPLIRVRFMKASHLPLLWLDSPVNPFRFNPKLSKEEQGRPKFVQIIAKFLPNRDNFGFIEQVAEPLEEPPKFLKASKLDKEEQRKKSAPPNTQLRQQTEKPIKKISRPVKVGKKS